MKQDVNTFMRNRDCVLNHLPMAKEKVRIMEKYGITPAGPHWPEVKRMLEELHAGSISAEEALEMLASRSGISRRETENDLLACYKTGLLECHITDKCDLNCIECHYRNKKGETIPYDALADYFKALAPKAITITGGGEPNCYFSQGKTLHDVVKLARQINPAVGLGLINNNTRIPEGDWVDDLDWQRTSVDAVDAAQYARIKGADRYEACVANIGTLLNSSDIPFVGLGFLYRKENIDSMPDFLQLWFGRFQAMTKSAQAKFNIQFRPIAPGIDEVADYDGAEWGRERRAAAATGAVISMAADDPAFERFLREKTNFYSINADGYSYFLHTPKPFTHCYNALLHRVLRADGDEYPDFLLCNLPGMALGNVMKSASPDLERVKIALGTFYFYHRLAAGRCNPNICRQGWVSNAIETNWDADTESMGVPRRYFF